MRILKIVAGVVLILTGVFSFANLGATFLYIAFILGCAMLFSGIIGILAYILINTKKEPSTLFLAEGIVTVIMGSLVLANLLVTDAIVPLFFGMWVMFAGIQRAVLSHKMKKVGVSIWKWILIQGIISIFAGIYAFVNPALLNLSVIMIVGILFIIQGINVLTTGINISIYKMERRNNSSSTN